MAHCFNIGDFHKKLHLIKNDDVINTHKNVLFNNTPGAECSPVCTSMSPKFDFKSCQDMV